MLTWEQFLLSQVGMNRRKNPFVTKWSGSGLNIGDELWGIFITTLS
jgi:hypothetical protein